VKQAKTKCKKILSSVTMAIMEIWQKSGIPVLSQRRIENRLEKLLNDYKNTLKKKGEYKELAMEKEVEHSHKLFDIAACKCVDFLTCNCSEQLKVPSFAQKFLVDQRTTRQMRIGRIDKEATSTLQMKNERQVKLKRYYERTKVENYCAVDRVEDSGDESE